MGRRWNAEFLSDRLLELFPYEEAQAKYFFGREADIRNVAERVYRSSLVLLYGESGVGKTSLIQAGVLPLLRREGFRVASTRIGLSFGAADLLNAVQSAVCDLLRSQGPVDSDDSTALSEAFQRVAELLCTRDQRLVVVLDQLEVLFQTSSEIRMRLAQVFSPMVSFAQRYRSVAFLLSVRADYLNDLGIWAEEHQIPEIWRNSYPVQKLSASHAVQVLDEVPGSANAEFSREAVRAIVDDLQKLDDGRVYPPNLQIIASKVFETARSHTDPQTEKLTIGLEDYEAVGGTEGVLESFLDEKLTEFGSDRDLAHHMLLALVSATGKRLSLSEAELSECLSETPDTLKAVIEKLVEDRLVRPTDQPRVYELVHDVLALKVLEATEEEQRKAKAAREAFELAVNTWQTDQVLESPQKLDLLYEHRHSLDIGEDELVFLLFSESQRQDRFAVAFGSSIHEKRLRWINLARPSVCISALDRVREYSVDTDKRESAAPGDTLESLFESLFGSKQAQIPTLEITTDLCSASSFEVQKELLVKLEEIEAQPMSTLYRQAYQSSPIPTRASLSYLQDMACCDLRPDAKRVVAYRILGHYLSEFPIRSWSDSEPAIESRIEEWTSRFPEALLDDQAFRSMTFDYLRELPDSTSSRNGRERERVGLYRIEMFKLLYERDPDGTVQTMWDMVNATPYISWADTDILDLLRVYDPERTVGEVVRLVERRPLYHVTLLESMEAPETDELLIGALEEYVQGFEGGSKRWYGGGVSYARKLIREVAQAVGRRQLEAAVPHLAAIAIRYEQQDLKLDCMDALVDIGDEGLVDILVELLDDGFKRVRNKASKHLLEMDQQRHTIVAKTVESIGEQEERKYRHKAKRSDAMRRKINTLRRLRTVEAIEVLEQVARNDSDKSVRETAARAVKMLKGIRDSA
jgi:hypothetical protein